MNVNSNCFWILNRFIRSGFTSVNKNNCLIIKAFCFLAIIINSIDSSAKAQIVPDRTLPVNTNIDTSGNLNTITGGTAVQGNLFHSFEQFSLESGATAYFKNSADVQNIISRVTGNAVSNIDGLIRANGNANLFLLNPNGIIFGQNASLNIGGSFLASTATSLKFADGTEFSTVPNSPNQTPLLTINTPIGLQFGKNGGTVVNNGNLIVNFGQNISLLGSNVSNTGLLKAPDGQITLASAPNTAQASLGENGKIVGLQFQENNPSPTIENLAQTNGTTITTGTIDTSSPHSSLPTPHSPLPTIKILGDRVSVDSNAVVNASGNVGGGQVFIGGNYQGIGEFPNATATFVSPNATIQANALNRGDGGKIVVWSDNSTRAYGNFQATGGVEFGNGGLIETSGKNFLDVAGINVDARAFNGNNGTWLLDPRNVTLGYSGTSNGSFNGDIFTPSGDGATVDIPTIQAQLNAGTNVTITTGSTGNQDGNITANNFGIEKNTASSATLTLQAANDINLKDFGINSKNNGALNLILQADSDNDRKGSINIASAGITTAGGKFIATASNSISITKAGIGTAGGELTLLTQGKILIEAGLKSENTTSNNAAPINLTADEIIASVGGIAASATGSGNAAPITINARAVELRGKSGIESSTSGDGNAGNVSITTDTLLVQNESGVKSQTFASGSGGLLKITANSINVTNSSGITNDTGIRDENNVKTLFNNTGNAGRIEIQANRVSVSKNAGITSETAGRGQAGEIKLVVDSLLLKDNGNITTSTFRGSSGNAGRVEVTAKSVLFENEIPGVNSGLGSVTRGRGDAGTIVLNADTVVLRNRGGFGINTEADGNAGKLFLTANNLRMERSAIGSNNLANGKGGEVNVNVNTAVMNRSSVSTRTDGTQEAGTINFVANSLIMENGSDLNSNTRLSGKGGNINLTINGGLTMRDNSKISVSSEVRNSNIQPGRAGDIDIQANLVQLDNRSRIIAETASGDGGNIGLRLQDLLLLRRNGEISTSAGLNRGGGDGGNININTPFIVAFPTENSNIAANASLGKGGRVDITTQGIFGIRFNDEPTEFSDITASSEFGVNGIVNINTPEVDPSRALIELPINLVDPSQQIAQACTPGNRQRVSSFVTTGRSGIPTSPIETLTDETVIVDWINSPQTTISNSQLPSSSSAPPLPTPNSQLPTPNSPQIVEAQGWIVDTKGNIVLVANASQVNPHSSWSSPNNCHVR
ncbi:MAG: filamentous hemagglutinin N-terminal domain-containing protein [Scytonematopsis contorta HA4267-MV1]|jgi:filamentous hemagglutinin family protein|nr:filamentous hemagglutinin N-terminal domain-containing protein [Scytonematopsis contorta HA4267-MV1]